MDMILFLLHNQYPMYVLKCFMQASIQNKYWKFLFQLKLLLQKKNGAAGIRGKGLEGATSIHAESYPILPMNQEPQLVGIQYLEQNLSSVRGWGRMTERHRIHYRLNKLLCYCVRSLQSKTTADGSFCQRGSWEGYDNWSQEGGLLSKSHHSSNIQTFNSPVLSASLICFFSSSFSEQEQVWGCIRKRQRDLCHRTVISSIQLCHLLFQRNKSVTALSLVLLLAHAYLWMCFTFCYMQISTISSKWNLVFLNELIKGRKHCSVGKKKLNFSSFQLATTLQLGFYMRNYDKSSHEGTKVKP